MLFYPIWLSAMSNLESPTTDSHVPLFMQVLLKMHYRSSDAAKSLVQRYLQKEAMING